MLWLDIRVVVFGTQVSRIRLRQASGAHLQRSVSPTCQVCSGWRCLQNALHNLRHVHLIVVQPRVPIRLCRIAIPAVLGAWSVPNLTLGQPFRRQGPCGSDRYTSPGDFWRAANRRLIHLRCYGQTPESMLIRLLCAGDTGRGCDDLLGQFSIFLTSVRIPAKANTHSEGNANSIPGRRRTVFGA